jgi:LPXTG-motif cell wall-anchored protein
MGGVNQDLLSQLAPAHAPAAAPWWPLAPGWWVLLGLTLLLALAGWLFMRRRQPQQRVRVVALHELDRIAAATTDDATFARDLEHLLRRYAVTRFGRATIAQLNGRDWLAFIAAHGGAGLDGATGEHFLRLAFGGRGEADRTAWLAAARAFLKDRTS